MINILTEQNVQVSLASLKPTDILISPELGGFSAGDFDHLPQDGADRRGGSAQSRRSPVAAQPARRAIRCASQASAGRRAARSAADRRNPVSRARACQSRLRPRRDGDPDRPAARPADARPRHAAPLRHRRLRARELPDRRGGGQADPRGRCGREVVGTELPALRPRAFLGLPGRRVLQPARRATGAPGSTGSGASGGSTCRSGAPPAHTPSSISRSTRGNTSSSRPTPSSIGAATISSTTTSAWRSTTCATTAWASTSAASSRATARCASGC